MPDERAREARLLGAVSQVEKANVPESEEISHQFVLDGTASCRTAGGHTQFAVD